MKLCLYGSIYKNGHYLPEIESGYRLTFKVYELIIRLGEIAIFYFFRILLVQQFFRHFASKFLHFPFSPFCLQPEKTCPFTVCDDFNTFLMSTKRLETRQENVQ